MHSHVICVASSVGRALTINGFSAHADRAELLAWHGKTAAKRTFLVHGEVEVMGDFADALTHTEVEMPALNQAYEL